MMPEQEKAELLMRRIYNMGYEDFCRVLNIGPLNSFWLAHWQRLHSHFIDGWFGLDEQVRTKLWTWAENYQTPEWLEQATGPLMT